MKRSIWIGWDPREAAAYAIARQSCARRLSQPIGVHGLLLEQLTRDGLYTRPLERRDGRLWDPISAAPMSTQHAIARFCVPQLAGGGWALFMDGDVLVREDLAPLFDRLDPAFALYCVQHDQQVTGAPKMDGQAQQPYARKNWSSVMVFNCDHPANRALTPLLVNTAPGRELHRFCWLADELIGALPTGYNHLVGHTRVATAPAIVHFTEGTPDMPGYEGCAFAEDWRAERRLWAA